MLNAWARQRIALLLRLEGFESFKPCVARSVRDCCDCLLRGAGDGMSVAKRTIGVIGGPKADNDSLQRYGGNFEIRDSPGDSGLDQWRFGAVRNRHGCYDTDSRNGGGAAVRVQAVLAAG